MWKEGTEFPKENSKNRGKENENKKKNKFWKF